MTMRRMLGEHLFEQIINGKKGIKKQQSREHTCRYYLTIQ
jgi:hypothetical protein